MVGMATNGDLSEIENFLREKFEKEGLGSNRLQSTAAAPRTSERLDQLLLPRESRPKMPLTKDKYLIRENPQLVAWERVTREFLRGLTLATGHRISAAMVYEWATGLKLADLNAQNALPNHDLRKINKILRHHFGKPYSTYIMNRKVPNCYRVPPQWQVKTHRPLTNELALEYWEGTLEC